MFIDGKLDRTLRGDGLVDEFIEILEDYVAALPARSASPGTADDPARSPDRLTRPPGRTLATFERPPIRVYTSGQLNGRSGRG